MDTGRLGTDALTLKAQKCTTSPSVYKAGLSSDEDEAPLPHST